MADIHVVFQNNRQAFVLEDPEAVMQNEILHWHFHTVGTPIKKVRLVFESPEAAFFPKVGLPSANEIKRDIEHGQTIWGRAPAYFTAGPPQSRPDKYTIEAFDQNNVKLDWATSDPTIRTDGP